MDKIKFLNNENVIYSARIRKLSSNTIQIIFEDEMLAMEQAMKSMNIFGKKIIE